MLPHHLRLITNALLHRDKHRMHGYLSQLLVSPQQNNCDTYRPAAVSRPPSPRVLSMSRSMLEGYCPPHPTFRSFSAGPVRPSPCCCSSLQHMPQKLVKELASVDCVKVPLQGSLWVCCSISLAPVKLRSCSYKFKQKIMHCNRSATSGSPRPVHWRMCRERGPSS